jgi:hypothetical protein
MTELLLPLVVVKKPIAKFDSEVYHRATLCPVSCCLLKIERFVLIALPNRCGLMWAVADDLF